MKRNLSARGSVRILAVTALVLFLSGCGSDPIPVPAPPAGGYGYGAAGLGSCASVSGTPVQTNGQQGYYGDLPSANPTSAGDFVMALFYQQAPTVGYTAQNVVGAGAVKIPALTGYLQNQIIPVCVTSNGSSPGQLNSASGGVRIKMTGPLPVIPAGTITSGGIPTGYPYGYQTSQSLGSIEVRVGWSCPAWINPQGRVLGCVDVISYGYPGGQMHYNVQ